MMSFVQMNKSEVVKKQYFYKLKAYKGSYSSLMIIQMIGLLFSLMSIVSGGGTSSGNFDYNYQVYSTDVAVGFTLLWAFITGMTITSQNYRYDDFSFVTNRQTSNMSNALYLLTISAIGGITAGLLGFVFRLLHPIFFSTEILATPYTLSNLVIGMAASTLYCAFFTSLGYLAGMIMQFNKAFKYILPIVFLGLWFGFGEFMLPIFKMYFLETSLLLFFVKTAVMFSLCLLLASGISNRMEVRK